MANEQKHNINKIIIIAPSVLSPEDLRGGIENIDYNISMGLSNRFKISIIGSYTNDKKNIPVKKNFLIKRVNFKNIFDYPPDNKIKKFCISWIFEPWLSLKILVELLKTSDVDLFILHNGFNGLATVIIAKIRNIPAIYSEGNLYPWIVNKFGLQLNQIFNLIIGLIIAQNCKIIRVQSDLIRDRMIKKKIDRSKIVIIPGGISCNSSKEESSYKSRTLTETLKLAFIGRLEKEKGVLPLIELITYFETRPHNIEFIIFGNGTYNSRLLERSNVRCKGFVDRNSLNDQLNDIDMVLNFQDGVSLALIEAMAIGKIVVSYDSAEITDVINNGFNGFIVERSTDKMANKIIELSNNLDSLDEVSSRAILTIRNKYCWNVIVDQWEKIIQPLIG